MRFHIAIHPDNYTAPGKETESDASSPRWARLLLEAGHEVRWVDVRRSDIIEQLSCCHAFMWRWAHFDGMSRIARRLLPVVERELKIAVYPDQNTCWHYDDKIAQAYLLKSLDIPVPKTWIWFDRDSAIEWALGARYPVVLKLAGGAGSSNVKLIKNSTEACLWIERMFKFVIRGLDEAVAEPLMGWSRIKSATRIAMNGINRPMFDNGFEPQTGYVLFQEFLDGNTHDTRVTVIGDRAFGFRRFNRPNDFRASGSGNLDMDPSQIDERFIRLGFLTARMTRSQSCAIDGLYSDGQCVVGEISYTYVSSAIHDCPGRWKLTGDPLTGKLIWEEGRMWPEEAQVSDFLDRLSDRLS